MSNVSHVPKVASVSSNAAKRGANVVLNPSKMDLPEELCRRMVILLQARLCDAVDLVMQCKQAHWTVKGPHFAALHQLFDDAHDDMRGFMDLIAERAVTLGGQVNGTVQAAAAQSSLPGYPVATHQGLDHVRALSQAMAHFAAAIRKGIDEAGTAGDAVTADVLTQVGGALDKRLWMLDAHAHG